jgi:hypothetical protein
MEKETVIQETDLKPGLARMAGFLKSFQFTGLALGPEARSRNPSSIIGSGRAQK